MDEILNRRLQLAGAATVALSYFLPWVSIMSPLGSTQLKGLYIDYSWALILLAIIHISTQFSSLIRRAFGIPETAIPYMKLAHRVIPVVLVTFVFWQGAWFLFNAHTLAGVKLFGIDLDSVVKVGLDFGYWLAASGAVLLAFAVAASAQEVKRFAITLAGILIIVVVAAFGLSRPGKETTATAVPNAPEYDFSPYVQIVSVKANTYDKDYEASRFAPKIVITPIFRNIGTKMIIGIRGRIVVLDAFGHKVYSFSFRDDDKLAAGAESRDSGYGFEDNEFDDDDPFSTMYPLVSANNAKYKVTITALAFEDGSTLPPNWTDSQ